MARASAALWRRTWLRATLTLSPPLAWFLVIYLASLVVMLLTAFWTVNPFTNNLQHQFSLTNFRGLFDAPDPRDHRADRPARGAGYRDRHHPGLPVCLLHGEGGDSTGAAMRFSWRYSFLCGPVIWPASTPG